MNPSWEKVYEKPKKKILKTTKEWMTAHELDQVFERRLLAKERLKRGTLD